MLLPPKIITRNQNVQSNVTTKSFDIRDNITSIVWKMTYFGVTWVETRKRDWKLSPFLFCAALYIYLHDEPPNYSTQQNIPKVNNAMMKIDMN